ncbi:unnamed protein product [Ectocarpus sp. 6 AP-2014]
MGIDITISTRQGACYAGDVIEGAVHLNVSAKNEEGSSADELVLRLYGVAKTRVMYDTTNMAHNNSNAQSYTHREMLTEKKEFLSYDVQLAAFGGKAASGSHSFPFQVMLPPGLPPSMEENGSQGGSCEIFYGFEARLHRPGMLHFDAKGKAKLTVLSKPHEAGAATPVVVGPATQTVKKFCCFKSGSMSIGFQADHSEVGLNETVGLTVVARNDSSAEVKTMHVEIKQVSTWFARGYKESKTRTVAAVVVPGTQLRASEKGNQRGRSSAVIADTARADLQEQLGAGAGTHYDLLVPGNSLLTLQAGLIEVKHTLSVMLKTPHCISSPDVWTPLLVHAGTTSAPDEVSGEGSFVPHSGEAIPFATGLDDEGNVKPVSVPQSAVTMEYTNNISKF